MMMAKVEAKDHISWMWKGAVNINFYKQNIMLPAQVIIRCGCVVCYHGQDCTVLHFNVHNSLDFMRQEGIIKKELLKIGVSGVVLDFMGVYMLYVGRCLFFGSVSTITDCDCDYDYEQHGLPKWIRCVANNISFVL